MQDAKKNIIDYLSSHKKMTLATSSPEGKPIAHTVEYVAENGVIFFGTDQTTRKVQNIKTNPNVAYAVDEDYDDWPQIKGVQMQGTAEIVTDESELKKVIDLFTEHYPYTTELPSVEGSIFVKIQPNTGYYLDYSKGFGRRAQVDFAA